MSFFVPLCSTSRLFVFNNQFVFIVGGEELLMIDSTNMDITSCVCIHSFHTLSSHCSFDLQKAVVKDFLTGHKCLAADQSTHRAMRLVTKRRDPRPKYFLPSVAIHRSSNIRPPPIYSFLPTSAPSSVTSLMGGHRDWSPVGWVVTS